MSSPQMSGSPLRTILPIIYQVINHLLFDVKYLKSLRHTCHIFHYIVTRSWLSESVRPNTSRQATTVAGDKVVRVRIVQLAQLDSVWQHIAMSEEIKQIGL